MPNTSMAIANEFLKMPGELGQLTQMQLQKLTYIAHGWTLALLNQPLAADEVQAWDYGPVFPDLYDHAKYFGSKPIDRLITKRDDNKLIFFVAPEERGEPYVANLNPSEKDIIERVWKKYSVYGAFKLSNLTHQPGTPWYETYFGHGKNAPIPNEVIREHYLALANGVPLERQEAYASGH